MDKPTLQRLKNNSLYIIISLLSILKGLGFLLNRKFFFYPPKLSWLMNNVFLDYSMIIVGIALFIYVGSTYSNNRVLGLLLGIITVFLVVITSIEAEHVFFAGQVEFIQNVISNLIIVAFIFWTARHYSKRQGVIPVHIDVSNIITTIVSLILGYFAFSQNSKKSDLDKDKESHDYIQDQNDRLNKENKKLLKENEELREELNKNDN